MEEESFAGVRARAKQLKNSKEAEEKRKAEEARLAQIAREAEEKRTADENAAKAEQARVKAEEDAQKAKVETISKPSPSVSVTPVSSPATTFNGDLKEYAKAQICNKWGCDQWPAFDFIVNKESTWNMYAVNPSSGALGLCQNNPYSRAIGDDYRYNGDVQVNWCIDYIAGRYGDVYGAKRFWVNNNWF